MKEPVCSKNQIRRQLFADSKGWLSAAVFSMAMLSAYNIVISWLLQKIIDIAAGMDPAPLSFILIIAIATFIVFMLSYCIYRTARPRFLQAAMTQYKACIFEKILEKKIGSLSNEGTGRLISALTNDMRLIEDHYLDAILEFVDIGVSFAGALLLMLWYDPLLTLCSVLFSILPLLVSVAPSQKLAEAEKRLSEGNAVYVGIIKDILSGFTVIKSFQAEKQIHARFETDNINIETMKFQRRYAEENVNLLSTAASVMMRLGIFMAGAWMAVSGTGVTPGTVLVFLQLVTFVIAPIERLPARLANRKAAIAVMDRLSDFLSLPDEVPGVVLDEMPAAAPAGVPNAAPAGIPNAASDGMPNAASDGMPNAAPDKISNVLPEKALPHPLKGSISVRDLSFAYEHGKHILKHIDLDFQAGKKYAIVGGSGSGKTTFLNLLMQTANDYEGRILFDGTELRRIHPDSLFGALSLVQQNVFVFQDTLYNNITLYKSFSDSDFQSAVSAAGLSELLSSRGKEYPCGENGNALSGGEKQRVSIARALLRKSSILLMDEATAALDEITAKEIMNSILEMENMTRIIVTHRLDENTMKQYDEIIVLNHGRVSEQGTFAQLIAKRGLFYSLFTVSQSA